MHLKGSILFLIILFSFSSCIKEKFDADKIDLSLSFAPGLAVPVGYSHLAIAKYLNDSSINEIRIAPDGFISIYYSTPVTSGTMSNLLSLSQVNNNKTLINQTGSVIDLQTAGPGLDLIDSILIPVSLVQTTARIDSMLLLSGDLQVNLTATNLTGTITYQFPGLRMNGVAFSITRDISNPGFSLSLANYSVIPEQIAGENIFRCILSVHLENPTGPVNSGSTILNLQTIINNLSYETIWGDFSGYNLDPPPFGISTGIFDQISGGKFEFADPGFKLLFTNSIGVPINISFSQFDAIDRDNNLYSLSGTGVPTPSDPKIISYPALSQQGQTMEDSLVLNGSNSNIADLLASNPVSINITASAGISAPGGAGTSFISHDSEYDITAVIELPLWGKAEFLILTDTLRFNYLTTSLPVPEELERVIIQINITNSFPVTIQPQVYLLDENRLLLDSLFSGTEMVEGASDTNSDGVADPHKQDPLEIDLPRTKIDNLTRTRYLVTRGKIMTTGYPSEDVKFYSTYFLDYNIGLIAQLKIKTGK